MKTRLNNVRLSFPVLWTPEEYTPGDGKPRRGASFLMPVDDPQLAGVKKAINTAGEEKFGKKWASKEFREGVKMHCFKRGDGQDYDGYAGQMVITAHRSAKQGAVRVIDVDKSELTEDSGRPYAGCYVNAIVEFWGDTRFGKAMNATLIAVQYAGAGEAFAGGARYSEDDFDEVEAEDMDDLMGEEGEEGDYDSRSAEAQEDDLLA